MSQHAKPVWSVKTIEDRVLYEVKLPDGTWLRTVAFHPSAAIDNAKAFAAKHLETHL